MPKGVWSETNRYGNLTNYKADDGEGLYRRSMYTFWKRTAAPPSMLLFDAPNREVCYPKRSRTNTPLQALALLNEVTYVEAARSLAERMMKEGGPSIRDRLTTGYRLATARSPDKQTLSVLQKGFEERKIHFQDNQEAAKQIISHGKKILIYRAFLIFLPKRNGLFIYSSPEHLLRWTCLIQNHRWRKFVVRIYRNPFVRGSV